MKLLHDAHLFGWSAFDQERNPGFKGVLKKGRSAWNAKALCHSVYIVCMMYT